MLGIFACTSAFVFTAGGIQAVNDSKLQLVGRVAVVLLNLVVAHIAILVHVVALQGVKNGHTQRERLVLQETLLRHEVETDVVIVIVEVQLMAVRAEHQVDVETPIMLQREGVECVQRIDGLVEIGTAHTALHMWILEVEIKVLLLDTSRGIDRPDAHTRREGDIGPQGVDGAVEVDVLDERGVIVADKRPLRDDVLAAAVRSGERQPLPRGRQV